MSSLLITFVMTGVIWLFVAVRAVESIVNRGLSVKLFLLLTSLQIPNFLTQILPISLDDTDRSFIAAASLLLLLLSTATTVVTTVKTVVKTKAAADAAAVAAAPAAASVSEGKKTLDLEYYKISCFCQFIFAQGCSRELVGKCCGLAW